MGGTSRATTEGHGRTRTNFPVDPCNSVVFQFPCDSVVFRFCGERISGRRIGGKPVTALSAPGLVDDVSLAADCQGTGSRGSRVRRGGELYETTANSRCAGDNLNPIRIAHGRPGALPGDENEHGAESTVRGEF